MIYIALLMILGGSMVTSVWLANLVWVLLAANWLLEGRWAEKREMASESRLLQAFVCLYAIYVVGMLWTENVAAGLRVLQTKLPLLVVPIVLLTTKPVEGRARQLILAAYVGTVVVVSVIGAVRMLTIADLPYREAVPYISHIRFALNCCMVIYLCLWGVRRVGIVGKVALGGIVVWMLCFLLLIHSYTAMAVLLVVSTVMVVSRRRWVLVAIWFALMGIVAGVVLYEIRSYYHMVPQATAPLMAYTAEGNPYEHAQDGIIENGNYVNNYICQEELREAWSERSTVPYDSVFEAGYGVQPTLVRYLNALGLTKDRVGVKALSEEQIHQVEMGIANPVYVGHNAIRKMVYVMLLEREYYVHTHAVKGFSMLQRFELWRATWQVVKANRWVGVGTGDLRTELHKELAATDSELKDQDKMTHNQYLGFLATFGMVGFILVLLMFVRVWTGLSHMRIALSPVMLAWVVTIVVCCFTEDTLDTLAGILFCTYFLYLRKTKCTSIIH